MIGGHKPLITGQYDKCRLWHIHYAPFVEIKDQFYYF